MLSGEYENAGLTDQQKRAYPKLRAIQEFYAHIKETLYPSFLQANNIQPPQDQRAAERLRKKLMATSDWVAYIQQNAESGQQLVDVIRQRAQQTAGA
jgi:hypothetical protein